jgi:hypothetical protein
VISKLIRDAIKTQLSAAGTGLNDRIAALAASYGVAPYAIDWTANSTNFIFGRVSSAAFEESSVFTYPLLTIDTVRTQHTNRVKFATFAGPVIATVDVHHSWADESVLADFASLVDLTEDAVIAALNDMNHQSWPGNLLWNGQVGLQRGGIAMGGYGWIQSAQFILQFELIV